MSSPPVHILLEIRGGNIQRITSTVDIVVSIIDRDNNDPAEMAKSYGPDQVLTYEQIRETIESEIISIVP